MTAGADSLPGAAPDTPEPPDSDDTVPWLLEPADGVPPVSAGAAAVDEVAARFARGSGPVALDAERASGYRYSARAYLVQLRRAGATTALIDPLPYPDLSALQDAIGDAEWVLHAAGQDLPCLAEVGLRPASLFDTELAGRLLGYPRVALGTLLEELLGVRLEKGHSAADWSTRPLPHPWLVYAALDVELLLPLRDALEAELAATGKLELAREEFEHVRLSALQPAVPRAEPWRRLSGINKLRNPRQLAAGRALWLARDDIGRAHDIAPGRVLPDTAIVNAVLAAPADELALRRLPIFSGSRQRRRSNVWWRALSEAAALPDRELPRMTPLPTRRDDPPPANRWADRDPVAATRLTRVRAVLAAHAASLNMPVEHVLEPALARRLAWAPPEDLDAALVQAGARPWQRARVLVDLPAALADPVN